MVTKQLWEIPQLYSTRGEWNVQLKVRLVARSARKAPVIAHSIPKPA